MKFKEYLNKTLYHDIQSARDYETLNGITGKFNNDKPKTINLDPDDYILTIWDDRDNIEGMIAFNSEKDAQNMLDMKEQILDKFNLSGNTSDYTFDTEQVKNWKKSYPPSVRIPTKGFDYRN